jgi:hypothetical protein
MEEAFTSEHWIVRIFKVKKRYAVRARCSACVAGVKRPVYVQPPYGRPSPLTPPPAPCSLFAM